MRLAFGVMFFLTTALAGCSQGAGDTCQLDRDCESGLVCCKSVTAARGVCQAKGSCAPEPGSTVATDGGESQGDGG